MGGFGGQAGQRRGGWRPDPAGRFEERFFLAGQWTRRVRWGGAEAVDLQAVDDDGYPPTDWQHGADGASPAGSGWDEDPTGRFPERWWDGSHYTRKVRVGEAIGTDTTGAPETDRGSGRRGGGRDRRRTSRSEAPPPGWQDDPEGSGQRYWDGYQWTAKWRPGPPATGSTTSMRSWAPQTLLMVGVGVAVLLVVIVVVVALVLLL